MSMEAKEIVSWLDNASDYDRKQVDEGSSLGNKVSDALRELGWKTAKSYSRCTKATFEAHLEKDGMRVEIVSSVFMGSFTMFSVRPS